MAIRTSVQSGNTHSAPFAFGSAVVDGDQLQVTSPLHAVNFDQSCVIGISVPSSNQAQAAKIVTGSGGSLPLGNYGVRLAPVNANGIASPSPLTGGASITSAGQVIRVTIPALPAGSASWNVYLTEAGGGVATERRYATGVAPGFFDCSSALWESGTVPYASAAGLPFGDAFSYGSGITGHSAGVTIAAGVVVTSKGDFSIVGDLTLNGGSGIEFDASGSLSGGAVYRLYFGTVYAVGAPKLIMRGTSASNRAFIRSKAGTTPGHIVAATQFFTSSPVKWDLQWAEFALLGDAVNLAAMVANNTAYNQLLTDVIFHANCRMVRFDQTHGGAGFILTRVTFNSTAGNSFGGRECCAAFSSSANKTTATRTRTNCVYAALPVGLCAGGDVEDGAYMHDGWSLTPSGTGLVESYLQNSFIRKLLVVGGGVDTLVAVFTITGCYLYIDNITGPTTVDLNPHGIGVAGPGTGNPKRLFNGNTIEYNGANDEGDMYKSPGGTGEIQIAYNLIVPNAGSRSTGTLMTVGNAHGPRIEFFHNTHMFGAYAGISTSEPNFTPTDEFHAYQSNLGFDIIADKANRYLIGHNAQDGDSDSFDIIAPERVSHNAHWNAARIVDLYPSGYVGGFDPYLTRFSSAPGTNDVDLGDGPGGDIALVGPKFVDPTRKFVTFAERVLGATGTNAQKIAAGLNALKAIADPSSPNHVPGLTMDAAAVWVRAGFVPRDTRLRNAAHDGTDIGAMTMEPLPSSGGGARLIGIGCGRIAA